MRERFEDVVTHATATGDRLHVRQPAEPICEVFILPTDLALE